MLVPMMCSLVVSYGSLGIRVRENESPNPPAISRWNTRRPCLSVDELISLPYFKCVIRAVELCDYGILKVPACKHIEMKDV